MSVPSSAEPFREEKILQKIWRKAYQEPLIPLGCGLTCWALYQASRSMRAGDHDRTNRMFRARIYGQAFTIVAMVAGSYYYADERTKRKEFEGTIAERRAKEKQEAWIRELEHRQREEQELSEKRDALYRARQAALEDSSGNSSAATTTTGIVKSALEESERRRRSVLGRMLVVRPNW